MMPDGSGAAFHALNRGKRSVQIDIKSPTGRAELRDLLQTADVLLESFRPGVMAHFGLDLQELARDFPGLIICSITGFGQTGPDAMRAGHDINYLARSGVLGVMAEPQVLPAQFADIAGGRFGNSRARRATSESLDEYIERGC